jgi:arylsulfatase A-like enzyme
MRIIPFLLLLALLLSPKIIDAAIVDQPNILLIITDEHNFRTLGCYRKSILREQAEMWGAGAVVETPHLDSLAREGVLCTRAYATSPVCSPCRASIITGRYPHATGVPANDLVLDRSIPTLADRLNDAGYRTSFVGKWHLGGKGKPEWSPKVDGGFQHKTFMFNRGHWKKFGIKDGKPFVASKKKGKPSYGVSHADEKSFATDWLTDRAIDFISDSKSTKPFFSVISYPDPHGPNTVRAPYDEMHDDLPFAAPRTYGTDVAKPNWIAAKNHPEFRGEAMSRYFGMVKCIDDNVGRLIAKLKESGRLNNTLIIMTSDHGDLCYEHDRLNKGNPYEGSARVPMIFRLPDRIAAGKYFTRAIGTVDLTPTIIGLAGLPSNPDDHGQDLSSELADGSKPLKNDAPIPVTFIRNSGKTAKWVAAVDDRFKLVVSTNDEPWLFDASKDPDELENYFGRRRTKEITRRLAKALQEYGRKFNDPHLKDKNISASIQNIVGE